MQDQRDLAQQLKDKLENDSKLAKTSREEELAAKYLESIFCRLKDNLNSKDARDHLIVSLEYETEYAVSNRCGVKNGISYQLVFFDTSTTYDFNESFRGYSLGYDILEEKIDIDLMMSIIKKGLQNSGFYAEVRKAQAKKEIYKSNNKSTWTIYGYAVHVYIDWLGEEKKDIREEYLNTFNEVKTQNSGCYIATCVYGSYDCPEVWTLRRYRDYYLQKSALGRMFIRCYYAISPKLVQMFGEKKWFRNMWKNYLDKKVMALKNAGYEDTKYND